MKDVPDTHDTPVSDLEQLTELLIAWNSGKFETPSASIRDKTNPSLNSKGSHKENGLVMEIFRKGSTPLPFIFGSYGTSEAQFNFGHKRGKT